MKPHFAILPLLLLLPASAHAVELRFLVGEGTEDAFKFIDGGRTVSIHVDESSLSKPYSFTGPGPLVLFKDVARAGKTQRETAARLAVPAGLTHAIAILVADQPGTYASLCIDDSPATRQAGTLRMVNLSHHAVTFKLGTADFTVAPGENHQLAAPSDSTRVVLHAETEVNGRTEIVAGNPIPMRPGLRLLLVLRDGRPGPGRKTNIVDVLSFYDRPPVQPSQSAIGDTVPPLTST